MYWPLSKLWDRITEAFQPARGWLKEERRRLVASGKIIGGRGGERHGGVDHQAWVGQDSRVLTHRRHKVCGAWRAKEAQMAQQG